LEFYASPQAATDWEGNILGDNTIQANGDRTVITLPGNRGCLYDFLAVFADGDKLEKFGINVCELETHTYYETASVARQRNNSPIAICLNCVVA
ncbi:MAG: hypothetical protein AAF808_16345, partial [Cyanobacteria bacterium P01_D01_bin.2]